MILKKVSRSELVALYQSSKTVDEICKILGTNKFSFYKLLDRAGIPRKLKYKEQVRFELV